MVDPFLTEQNINITMNTLKTIHCIQQVIDQTEVNWNGTKGALCKTDEGQLRLKPFKQNVEWVKYCLQIAHLFQAFCQLNLFIDPLQFCIIHL